MVLVIIELLVAFLILTLSILGIMFNYTVIGWIGLALSLVVLGHVFYLVSTGKIKTPRGLASGVPIYDGREDDASHYKHQGETTIR
ncbi:hypothetical protein ACXZ66_03315 [Corynebacterium sp. S7]